MKFLQEFTFGGLIQISIDSPRSQAATYHESAEDLQIPNDRNVYFGPAMRSAKGAEKKDILGSKVLWVDIDEENRPLSTLPPSMLVFSGHGWHAYWILNQPVLDVDRLENLNKVLEQDVPTADIGCFNANRVLRVPGTMNLKDPKNPVQVTLEKHRPLLTYSQTDIEVVQQLGSKTRHKISTGDQRGYRSRSERDWAIITALINAGASDALIQVIFEHQACGDKHRENDHYLEHTLERAKKKAVESVKKPIIERPDGYYAPGKKQARRISTFVFDPKVLLDGSVFEEEDALVCDVQTEAFTWEDQVFSRMAFTTVRRMDRECPVAAWQFLGRDTHVRHLLPYLLDKLKDKGLPRVAATPVLGLHKIRDKWLFLGDEEVVSNDEIWEGFSGPLAWLPTDREHPEMELAERITQDEINHYKELVPRLHAPEAIWPMIGWYTASTLKPWIEEQRAKFPVLSVAGTKGSGKCVVAGTRIRLADGRDVPIEDVEESSEVVSWNNRFMTSTCSPVQLMGRKECYEIEMFSGRRITVSYDHPILTTESWKDAKDLKVDNYVIAQYKQNFDRASLPEGLARYMGYMIGDGSLTSNRMFTNSDSELVTTFTESAYKCGFNVRRVGTSGKAGMYSVSGGARVLPKALSGDKVVPDEVKTASQEDVKEFLAAYFECDGYVASSGKRSVQYDSKSRQLLRDVQELFFALGIVSRLRKTSTEYKGSSYWRLSISGYSAIRFAEMMDIKGKKGGRLRRWLPDWQAQSGGGAYHGGIPTNVVYDVLAHSQTYYWRHYGSSLASGGREIARSTIRRFIEVLKDTPDEVDARRLERLLDNKVFYDRVIGIQLVGDKPVYNVEVKNSHTFLAEGLVTHNTTLIQQVFMPLLGQKDPRSYDSNTTRFVTLALLGSTNAIPIAFSEFRYGSVSRFIRFVLLAYDTGHDPRGRADQSTQDYPLSAPFTLDGEDLIEDPAARERIVVSHLKPQNVREGSPANEAFAKLGRVNPAFGGYFIKEILKRFDRLPGLLKEAQDAMHEAFPKRLPPRIRNNYSVTYFGMKLWEEILDASIPSPKIFEHSIKMVYDFDAGRARTFADSFIEDIVNQVANGSTKFNCVYDSTDNVVWFQFTPTHGWWIMYRRTRGTASLGVDAMRIQVKEAPYVVGPKAVKESWMYGVDLKMAFEMNLDIPRRIKDTVFVVRINA